MQTTNNPPISPELLEILRCPQAVQERDKYGDDPGRLELVHNCWLVSRDSGLKYPVRNGIPVMLIEEGLRWKDTPVADLPVPPPAEDGAPAAEAAAPAVGATRSVQPARAGRRKLLIVAAIVLALIVLLRRRD